MLGLMKRANLVKCAMTPNRIIEPPSSEPYSQAALLGYMVLKIGSFVNDAIRCHRILDKICSFHQAKHRNSFLKYG